MATMTQNLVALTPGGDITEDHIAGWYLLVRVGEEGVPLRTVRKAFKDNGLDPDRLPKARRPEHVMMDACSKAQQVHQNGTREEIRAQQVDRDENFVIYQMTRHVHDLEDPQNRVIEHRKLLRVIYSFEHEALSFEALDGHAKTDVKWLEDQIQGYYDAHQAMMPGRNLRTYVRHYIEEAGALAIVDGDYFLAKDNKISASSKKLEAMIEFHGAPERGEWRHPEGAIKGALFIASMKGALNQIYKGRSDFHEIPCVNDEGQRAFLKRKFTENCAEDAERFRNECMELIAPKDEPRKRGFRSDVRDRLVKQRAAMNERRQQFEAIVGETITDLDRNLKLADQALAKFLMEADA